MAGEAAMPIARADAPAANAARVIRRPDRVAETGLMFSTFMCILPNKLIFAAEFTDSLAGQSVDLRYGSATIDAVITMG
jgi:hypothetical protein